MFHPVSEHISIMDAQHYSDRPVIGLVRGEKKTLLFEAGASRRHAQEICEGLGCEPSYIVISHWHWDHSFGLCHFHDAYPSCMSISSVGTSQKLVEMSTYLWDEKSLLERVEEGSEISFCEKMMMREYEDTSSIEVVNVRMVFEQELSLDLGGLEVRLIHAGGPHSDDSIICYVPSERFLFLGDACAKDFYSHKWDFNPSDESSFERNINAIDYDREKLSSLVCLLEDLDFEKCITGHGSVCTKAELLGDLKGYI